MNAKPSTEESKKPKAVTVPRDADVETAETSSRDVMPSPDTVNMPDEDYPMTHKPLPPDSALARKLHDDPPKGKDQLEVGSGGDAARPMKTGIRNPNLPPRSQMK
jgi:hypothetical protein